MHANFLKKKHSFSTGRVVLVLVALAFLAYHSGKAHAQRRGCKGSSSDDASKVGTSTAMNYGKYELPRNTQEQVVVRKSIALLTTRGR